MSKSIEIIAVNGIPEVKSGDNVTELILSALGTHAVSLESNDILVVTQKIISKAEGRIIDLDNIKPSPLATRFSEQWDKDPKHVELMLNESRRIVRMEKGNIITETEHGFICAASGVDASNVPGENNACLLPIDPDASARLIMIGLEAALGIKISVIISDTWGRPWREGAINMAIGVAGINPLKDYKGTIDASGHLLRVTTIAIADELAAAAELVTGKSDNVPVSIIRGYTYESQPDSIRSLLRDPAMDLFR